MRSRPPILRHPDAIFDEWLEDRSTIPWLGDLGGQEYYKQHEEDNLVKQNEAAAIHNSELQYNQRLDKKKSELVNAVQNILEIYNNLRKKIKQSYNITCHENLKDKYINCLADINETELFLNETFLSQNINDKNINELIEKAKNIGIYSGDFFENQLNFLELKHKFSIPSWNTTEKLELLNNIVCERGTYLSEVEEENPHDFSFDPKFFDQNVSKPIRLQYHTENHGQLEQRPEIYDDDDMSLETQIPDDVLVVRAQHQEKPVRIKINRNYYQTFEHENFIDREDDDETFFRRLVNNIMTTMS